MNYVLNAFSTISLHHCCLFASLTEHYLCVYTQQEHPYDAERCLIYPLQLDLDLERDLGDDESFDVEDCKILTSFLVALLMNINQFAVCDATMFGLS